ncbi:MAG TPA: SurA N-terminal domain-containing protein [Solirubrobacterales bacterium]
MALVVFGAIFVLLFVGFAIAQGIGSPSVPSGDVAKIDDVPAEIGEISEKDLERGVEQQAAQAKLKKPPAPGSKKHKELQEAALKEMIERAWITGQAEEMGIKVTDKQVEEQLAEIKKQSFPSKGAYAKFLKEAKFTQEDVDVRVEQQVLVNAIQEKVNAETPAPSASEVESYYEAEKSKQFTEKESRDVRVVINKDKGKLEAAKKELEKDSSPASWKKVVKKYSSEPSAASQGGLQKGITEELLQEPLKKAIFGSASGELVGPTKFETNWILLEVVKLNPQKIKSLAEVKPQIEETLRGEKQQEFLGEFARGFQSMWRSRTICAGGFVVENCSNYQGTGHPSNANPACYEANPKTPATECPAPVTPTSPALPGTVTLQEPKGKQFQQRPIPASAGEEAAGAAEVPTGAAPPEGAGEAETGE